MRAVHDGQEAGLGLEGALELLLVVLEIVVGLLERRLQLPRLRRVAPHEHEMVVVQMAAVRLEPTPSPSIPRARELACIHTQARTRKCTRTQRSRSKAHDLPAGQELPLSCAHDLVSNAAYGVEDLEHFAELVRRKDRRRETTPQQRRSETDATRAGLIHKHVSYVSPVIHNLHEAYRKGCLLEEAVENQELPAVLFREVGGPRVTQHGR